MHFKPCHYSIVATFNLRDGKNRVLLSLQTRSTKFRVAVKARIQLLKVYALGKKLIFSLHLWVTYPQNKHENLFSAIAIFCQKRKPPTAESFTIIITLQKCCYLHTISVISQNMCSTFIQSFIVYQNHP